MQPSIFDFRLTFNTEHNIQYISGQINIQKELPDLFLQLTVLIDSGNDNFDMIYLNNTLSFCKFLKNKKLNVFVAIAFQVMSEYVEMPTRCPLVKVK